MYTWKVSGELLGNRTTLVEGSFQINPTFNPCECVWCVNMAVASRTSFAISFSLQQVQLFEVGEIEETTVGTGA